MAGPIACPPALRSRADHAEQFMETERTLDVVTGAEPYEGKTGGKAGVVGSLGRITSRSGTLRAFAMVRLCK